MSSAFLTRDAQAKDRGAVDGVLLRVAHQFEHDGPWPRDGHEREAALRRAFSVPSVEARDSCNAS